VEDPQKFLSPQTLAKLQGLELRARRIVEGHVAGAHRSPYRGFSIEFAEHREYAPGDDLRYVDWKVFGRTDKIYLKQYEDETNLVCYVVFDGSESMCYQGSRAPMSKLEYAKCVAASLSWLVMEHQEAAGLVTYDHQIRTQMRPAGTASHWRQICQALERVEPAEKTDTGPIFHRLAESFRQRGVVVIISDLFDDVTKLLAGLKHFRYRLHDVIIFHVLDPDEIDFPFERPTLFRGMESLADVLADPRAIRKAYLKQFRDYLTQLQAGCQQNQLDYQLLCTDMPLDVALWSYLTKRMQQLR